MDLAALVKYATPLLALLTVVVLVVIVVSYHARLALATLQGYWHVYHDIYLLIDGNTIKVIDFAREDVLFEDTSVKVEQRIKVPGSAYEFIITRSSDASIDISAFDTRKIHLKLYPVIGDIRVIKDGIDVIQLIKDNALSFQYLQR